MKQKVYILSDEESNELMLQEFEKNGFEVVNGNNVGVEQTELLFCYKMTRDELKQRLNEVQYNVLAIAFLSEDVKEIYCDKPTLIIKDKFQLVKSNVFQKTIDREDIRTLINETCGWATVLIKDINMHGMPLFNKIKAEEVSCRMISFDEQYPIEFKLV